MLSPLMILVAALAAPTSPGAASHFTGIARARADGPMLYREDHYRYGPADARRGLVLYRCPDGTPFARKTTRDADAMAPDFALDDAQNGYREGVRTRDGQRRVYVHRVGGDTTRSAPLPAVDQPVIDSGFNAFVHAHWDALVTGRTLKMQFLVPSRLTFLDFRIQRHRDAEAAARGIMVVRLELDRWFAFALPHIDVGYDLKTRTLRRFRGLSNLRDSHGNNVKVQLTYPPGLRGTDVTPEQIQAAQTVPLVGRCSLD